MAAQGDASGVVRHSGHDAQYKPLFTQPLGDPQRSAFDFRREPLGYERQTLAGTDSRPPLRTEVMSPSPVV